MATPTQIQVDIVSDVVCPWCVIGYRQLERAIGQMQDRAEVSVRWHPFQLAPDLPPDGKAIADYTRERYGATPEQGAANRERITAVGADLGIDFRFGPASRIYNTNQAHQLLVWAGEQGKQTALKLALFDAYFTDQTNVSDPEVLLDVVESVGLDREMGKAVLDDGRYAPVVAQEAEYWRDQNVTGVPAFVINGKYMIPGAQDADTFVQVLNRVIERQSAT